MGRCLVLRRQQGQRYQPPHGQCIIHVSVARLHCEWERDQRRSGGGELELRQTAGGERLQERAQPCDPLPLPSFLRLRVVFARAGVEPVRTAQECSGVLYMCDKVLLGVYRTSRMRARELHRARLLFKFHLHHLRAWKLLSRDGHDGVHPLHAWYVPNRGGNECVQSLPHRHQLECRECQDVVGLCQRKQPGACGVNASAHPTGNGPL